MTLRLRCSSDGRHLAIEVMPPATPQQPQYAERSGHHHKKTPANRPVTTACLSLSWSVLFCVKRFADDQYPVGLDVPFDNRASVGGQNDFHIACGEVAETEVGDGLLAGAEAESCSNFPISDDILFLSDFSRLVDSHLRPDPHAVDCTAYHPDPQPVVCLAAVEEKL